MKKKLLVLLSIMLMISLVSWQLVLSKEFSGEPEINNKFKIVTSFYPVYIAAKNITEDAKGVELLNLTEIQNGCLHDYQLTTSDMKKLESADVLIINGAEMESFIQEIAAAYPDLKVIDSSEGISLLENMVGTAVSDSVAAAGDILSDAEITDLSVESEEEQDHLHEAEHVHEEGEEHTHEDEHVHEEEEEHTHEAEHVHEEGEEHTHEDEHVHEEGEEHTHEAEHGHAGHDHGAYNGHIWMNPDNYMIQVQNISKGLASIDSKNADLYKENAQRYKGEIAALGDEMRNNLSNPANKDIIIFHDSFAYFADYLGLNVAYTVNLDGETALSAGEIAHIIDIVKDKNIKVLYTEAQYKDTIASNISEETDAEVYIIDSLVTGSTEQDAYLQGMHYNLNVLSDSLLK